MTTDASRHNQAVILWHTHLFTPFHSLPHVPNIYTVYHYTIIHIYYPDPFNIHSPFTNQHPDNTNIQATRTHTHLCRLGPGRRLFPGRPGGPRRHPAC